MSKKPQDIRSLYEVLGALLDTLADVPEVTNPQAEWRLGWLAGGDEQIRWNAFGVPLDRGRELLEQVRDLLGGGTITPSDDSTGALDGRRRRAHTLRAEFRGVMVAVLTWLPEPTEREALLARLAELDAAEGGEPR